MKNIKSKVYTSMLAVVAASMLFVSCGKDDELPVVVPPAPIVKPDVVFFGLTNANQIIRYNARTTEAPDPALTVTGLAAGETLLSIDFRPATGQLYGLGSSSRLYFINLNTGVATALGAASFTPALSGTIANIDFNPTVDRVRLVTNTGQNLRLHPELGTVAATDLPIAGNASPSITSIAYTNSIAGAATTDLYDIDISTKKLFKQTPPNDGTLVEVGNLGVNFTGRAGFDINADNSAILATLVVDNVVKLYTVNVSTAATTFIANIAANIVDIAIPTQAVAYAISDAGVFQIFNPTKANSVVNKTITGLNAGESLAGIDMRPATGQLYGLATTLTGMARLVTFNLSTGAATGVGTGFTLGLGTTAAGLDFNPTVDRIRLVTNTGQNIRLNPIDGTVAATDMSLNPGTPNVSATAYSNNFAGATTTSMFVLDATKLYLQNPPNNGTLTEIGTLGVTIDAQNGFDIGGRTNNAFGLFTVANVTKVYTVNTTTGAITAGVDYPNKVSAMAVGLGF